MSDEPPVVKIPLPGSVQPGDRILWAMDLDGDTPVKAHRVVNTEHDWRRAGDHAIVRVTACGERRTIDTHPRGWWTCAAGELPLPLEYIHCGVLP